MRGIVFTGEGAEVRTDVEVIDPGPDEVLVRLVAAGVCHSDVSLLDGTIPWPAPSLMGHEGAGVVEAVGSLVTRVKPGDHVVIATVSNCGICDQCSVGKPTWCRKTLGNRREIFTVGGEPAGNFAATSSFAEMTVVKEVQAVPIDPEVPLTSACLIACGVVTGMGSVFNRANVQPGDNVAVFGAGGVGLSTIQALRIKAANHIIAVDTVPSKGELALAAGRDALHQRGRGRRGAGHPRAAALHRRRCPRVRSAPAASTGRSSASVTPRSPRRPCRSSTGAACACRSACPRRASPTTSRSRTSPRSTAASSAAAPAACAPSATSR